MVFIERCIDYREKATSGRRNLQICGHLRCRFAKNSPRRTTSTPAGVFCTLLASAPPICKLRGLLSIYADGYFRTSTDGRGVKQQRCFLLEQKTRHQQMYMDVHLLIRHLLHCIIKSVHPCTLLMANFGKAEISLLFKPAASVPLLKILNVS